MPVGETIKGGVDDVEKGGGDFETGITLMSVGLCAWTTEFMAVVSLT